MKSNTIALCILSLLYILGGSLFAQSQGPANIWVSGSNKGKFANPGIVTANSGSGAFAAWNDSRISQAATAAENAELESSIGENYAMPASYFGGAYGSAVVTVGEPSGAITESAGVQAWSPALDALSAGGSGLEQTIASGTAPAWNLATAAQARFTATSAATFSISNLAAGNTGTLLITQSSGTTPFVVTFPAGTRQAFGGTNTYTMSGTNTTDILYFRKSGTLTIIEGVVPGITP